MSDPSPSVAEPDPAFAAAVPPSSALGAALEALRAAPQGSNVLDRVSRVAEEIVTAMREGQEHHGLAAAAVLVRMEEAAPDVAARRGLVIALRRVLIDQYLSRWAPYLLDELYRDDARAVLARAGSDGTNILLNHLIAASTIAERRTYFDVLCASTEGLHLAIRLLEDERWYVVRNMAELMGELRLEAAVGALGKALQHADARVRRSAAMALAKIGTPSTVEHLRKALKDSDTETRRLVARSIEGRRAAALAMSLVVAAEEERDPELVGEYYLALGRIGTPDAVQALIKALPPGGRLFRKKPAGPRLAAVQGLRLAGGAAAMQALRTLEKDPDAGVREAAVKAIAELAAPSNTGP